MMKFLCNDQIDWTGDWFPTHIATNKGDAVPVYIGVPRTFLSGHIAIYMEEKFFKYIYEDKAMVFIHDPEPNMGDLDIKWDEVPDRKEVEHLHVFKEIK